MEVDEVEWALHCLDGVKGAVVKACEGNSGENQLVVYIVPRTYQHPNASHFHQALAATLPDYMTPSAFIFLDQLPLNSNFKVDRLALPEVTGERPVLDTHYVAPSTALQKLIAGIWAEVLALESVGIHDLFVELGGDSLDAQGIANKVRKKFALYISLGELLSRGTVADMAMHIDESSGDA